MSQQVANPETPNLLSKKEANDLVQMRSKVGILDRWIDMINQKVGEMLADGLKIHEGALDLVGEMNQHAKVLEKQDEEYREHVMKLKDISKVSKSTLLEKSILDEGNADFIEKALRKI